MHEENMLSQPEPHDEVHYHRGHGSKRHRESIARRQDYSTLDMSSKLIWNFRDIGHTLLHSYEGKGSQARILIVLSQAGPITQSQLTARLGIQPGSASEVLSKMEHAGYIVRTPSKTDQRTSDVTLTPAGQAAADEAKKRREQRHETMFRCLTMEEQCSLLTLLERLNADWSELQPEQTGIRR